MNSNAAVKPLPTRYELKGDLSWEGVGADADWEITQDGARTESFAYALLDVLGESPGRVRITVEVDPGS